MTIADIPEIAGLDAHRGLVRIPPELDVPLTDRVRRLIDTVAFRRLARISQLGLVSLVYPAAIHTRFEHSLGVYRLALLYLKQLARDERFAAAVRPADAELFIAAALLHDLGHWPFCHPIEDIRLPGVPSHESFADGFLLGGEIATCLRADWNINPSDVVLLLSETPRGAKARLLSSMLSGPIDVDKMDYLQRDSLHAGVPYGRNFDQGRLIGSLCLNEAGDGLAITEKGKTAAEMMVFARYVMFSEVYWHHGVRAATAMLERAFYLLHGELDLKGLFAFSVRRGGSTSGSPSTVFWSSASSTTGSRGGRTPGWRRVPRISPRGSARRWGGRWRRTKSCSTRRRSGARSSSTSTSCSSKKAATGRWATSRRSCGRWPGNSSTTTSNGSASSPTPAWPPTCAGC